MFPMNSPPPEETAVDKRIKLYKAIAGVLPGGSFVVEYLIDRIPGQRAERLVAYIEQLNVRLERLESLEFTKSYEYTALVENSIIEATKPISEKRLKWISSIVVPSITPTEQEIEFRRRALQILIDLSDNDVECLMAHTDFSSTIGLQRSMPRKHFISMADVQSLSAHDLFAKRLDNSRLTLHRDALIEKRLLLLEEDGRMDKHKVSDLGRLFLFVLGEEHSVR